MAQTFYLLSQTSTFAVVRVIPAVMSCYLICTYHVWPLADVAKECGEWCATSANLDYTLDIYVCVAYREIRQGMCSYVMNGMECSQLVFIQYSLL